jgi:hypothetical protein
MKINGPTLNPEYNELLIRWKSDKPECENCGRNLTGKNIYDIGTCWVGDCCHDKAIKARDQIEADESCADRYTRGAEGGWADLGGA